MTADSHILRHTHIYTLTHTNIHAHTRHYVSPCGSIECPNISNQSFNNLLDVTTINVGCTGSRVACYLIGHGCNAKI